LPHQLRSSRAFDGKDGARTAESGRGSSKCRGPSFRSPRRPVSRYEQLRARLRRTGREHPGEASKRRSTASPKASPSRCHRCRSETIETRWPTRCHPLLEMTGPRARTPRRPGTRASTGGGRAASLGPRYQASAAAFVYVAIVTDTPLPWFGRFPKVPTAVSGETGGPGDDLRIPACSRRGGRRGRLAQIRGRGSLLGGPIACGRLRLLSGDDRALPETTSCRAPRSFSALCQVQEASHRQRDEAAGRTLNAAA
jgi:hypothetical protein